MARKSGEGRAYWQDVLRAEVHRSGGKRGRYSAKEKKAIRDVQGELSKVDEKLYRETKE